MTRIRTFVAVDLSADVQRRAGQLIQRLGHDAEGCKWVDPQNLHLTLAFLGEVDETEIPAVCRSVAAAAGSFRSVEIEARGIGAFPDARRPHTIWMGIGAGRDELIDLQDQVARVLERLGFPRERRRFQPHVTLGRQRRGLASAALVEKLAQWQDIELGTCLIDEVVTYSSRLDRRGPTYAVLARAHLQG
jgi:2'-5' RNA ligase